MALLDQEINELRDLQTEIIDVYKSGKMQFSEYVKCRIDVYNQTSKRTNQLLQAFQADAKYGKRISKDLKSANLIGEGAAIDLSIEEREAETVRCTYDNRLITRQQCLDFSGSQPERCSGCPQQAVTKKLLISDY